MRRAQLPRSAKAVSGVGRDEPDPQPAVAGQRGSQRVVVICYPPEEEPALAARVYREGFDAQAYGYRGAKGFRHLREDPPGAILIDLSRMPSYGRWLAMMLREQKGTRGIPLVFLEGEPEKTRLVRRLLPDAGFANFARLGPALRKAMAGGGDAKPQPPKPLSVPLVSKLRISKEAVVALLHAPEGFEDTLGELPAGVRLQKKAEGAKILLVFVKSAAALGRELPGLAREVREGRNLWLFWPKKASGAASDLTLPRILEMCSALGLAGYKTCAADETWAGCAVGVSRRSRVAGG